METFAQGQVIPTLIKSVPGVKTAHKQSTRADLDRILLLKDGVIQFLAVDGRQEDPIYMFWLIHRTKALAHECAVVFTDIRMDSGWADLEKYFGGTKFGTLFVMRVSENACPSVCPSQRGMYLR